MRTKGAINKSKTIKEKTEAKTKKFLKAVNTFLAEKNGGKIPAEWSASLEMLENYYYQFTALSLEIAELDTLLVQSRYGVVPSPLLQAQNQASARLESIMKQLGLTLKSAKGLEIIEPQKKKSALDKFLEGTMKNKDVEVR